MSVIDFQKKSLDVKIHRLIANELAESLGRCIAKSGFEELVLMNLKSLNPNTIKRLGKGLRGYKVILSIFRPSDIAFALRRRQIRTSSMNLQRKYYSQIEIISTLKAR